MQYHLLKNWCFYSITLHKYFSFRKTQRYSDNRLQVYKKIKVGSLFSQQKFNTTVFKDEIFHIFCTTLV